MDQRGGYGIDPVDLWIHSLGTAIYARELARSVDTVDPQEAYLAGLLHDVGKFVLAGCCRELYPNVVQQARQGSVPLHNTESERLGYHHAEIGAWLAEPWRLPPLYAHAILHHHHPVEGALTEKSQFLLTGLVALANNLCYGQNLGSGGDPSRATLPPNVFKNLGIPRETIKQAIREAPLLFKEAMARIDWEPVSRDAFRALLDKARRPPPDRGEEREAAVSLSPAPPAAFQDLQGINALGLALLKCDTQEAAAAAVAEGLVSAFAFARAVCGACKDDQWEYRAEAVRVAEGCVCETRLAERSLAEDADSDDQDPWLHIELNGKGRVLGSVKVKPGGSSQVPLDVLGLLLAVCAKLAAQALERIGYQQRFEHLSEDLTLSALWLKQDRDMVESDRARQEEILQCLPLGLMLIDAGGSVGFANREARRLLGTNRPFTGTPLRDLLQAEGLDQAWKTCLQGVGSPYRETLVGCSEAPSGKRLRWKVVPLRDASQPVERVLLLLDEHPPAKTAPEQVLPAGAAASPERTRSGTA